MFSRILHRARYFVNTAQQKAKNIQMLKTMAQKLQSMKDTMGKTTPRSFALIFMLSTIPSFYFIYEMFENDYNSKQYMQSTNNSNFVFYGASLILYKMNFRNPSSKYTVERLPIKFPLVGLILGFIGIMLPPSDSKHIIWPAFLTDIFTMSLEVQLTNQGYLPFWFYSYRHYIRFFDILIFIIVYQSLKKYKKRRETHPNEFVNVISNQTLPASSNSLSNDSKASLV